MLTQHLAIDYNNDLDIILLAGLSNRYFDKASRISDYAYPQDIEKGENRVIINNPNKLDVYFPADGSYMLSIVSRYEAVVNLTDIGATTLVFHNDEFALECFKYLGSYGAATMDCKPRQTFQLSDGSTHTINNISKRILKVDGSDIYLSESNGSSCVITIISPSAKLI